MIVKFVHLENAVDFSVMVRSEGNGVTLHAWRPGGASISFSLDGITANDARRIAEALVDAAAAVRPAQPGKVPE